MFPGRQPGWFHVNTTTKERADHFLSYSQPPNKFITDVSKSSHPISSDAVSSPPVSYESLIWLSFKLVDPAEPRSSLTWKPWKI